MSLCWIFVDDNSIFYSNIWHYRLYPVLHHNVTSYRYLVSISSTKSFVNLGALSWESLYISTANTFNLYVLQFAFWQKRLLPTILQSWIHNLHTLFLKPAHEVCLFCCLVSDYKTSKVMGNSFLTKLFSFFSEGTFASLKITVSFCEAFLNIICTELLKVNSIIRPSNFTEFPSRINASPTDVYISSYL